MTLSIEEKKSLVEQHQRGIYLNKYNLELALIQENALTNPNADTVTSLEEQISDCDKKLVALNNELSQLNS